MTKIAQKELFLLCYFVLFLKNQASGDIDQDSQQVIKHHRDGGQFKALGR